MHDRSRFEVHCYALSANDSTEWRQTIMAGAEHFHDVSAMRSADIAKLIHSHQIQVGGRG